jgi:DNA-binding MarR family transcriptional regulator
MTQVAADIDRIGTAINELQRLLSSRRVHSRLAASANLALSQQATQVLVALGDTPRPIADLAAAARMDVGAVSRQLNVLAEQGLAVREPSPTHGRVVLASPTTAGAELRDHVRDVRSRHLADTLSAWSADERAQLGHLLLRLVHDLQATPFSAR